jgi:acetyltransferase
MRTSYLIADNPAIAEMDINPLLVTPDGVTALDARVILDPNAAQEKPRPYSHLAIRPYPDEYVCQKTLRDGANVLLRPIQPEDEPMWHQLLGRCSARSLWLRFRYLFKESTHELATRFCFIDYDRTMAIVAEVDDDGERQLAGVGRLVADADHHTAEYAVLVADAWQGRGLGTMLTDYCLEICHDWGIDRVVVETTIDNQRMQRIAERHDFAKMKSSGNEVLFEKQLAHVGTSARLHVTHAASADSAI